MFDRLRENRAMTILRFSCPNTGSRSLSGSTTARTRSVCLFALHQIHPTTAPTSSTGPTKTIACEAATSTSVGNGSCPPSPSNIFWKIGTMKISMIITARSDITSTTTG